MRAIIIDDKDSKSLLDALKLASFERMCEPEFEQSNICHADRLAVIKAVHKRFHFVVTRWLQDQGASGLQ